MKTNINLNHINKYLSVILLIVIAITYYYQLFPFFEFTTKMIDTSLMNEPSYIEANNNLYVYFVNWISILCVICIFFMKDKHVGNIVSLLAALITTMYLLHQSAYMNEINYFRENVLYKSAITDKASHIIRDINIQMYREEKEAEKKEIEEPKKTVGMTKNVD